MMIFSLTINNMRALFGIQALQVNSRRNWTQFNDRSLKLFSMTGLTMAPVPFLGYLVSMKDDKNSAKNSLSNLLVVLITVCITYCRACVFPLSPIVWDMPINIHLSLPRLQNLKIHLLWTFTLSVNCITGIILTFFVSFYFYICLNCFSMFFFTTLIVLINPAPGCYTSINSMCVYQIHLSLCRYCEILSMWCDVLCVCVTVKVTFSDSVSEASAHVNWRQVCCRPRRFTDS